MSDRGCWLQQFSDKPTCAGRMDRAHLVTRQLLRREGHDALIPDERTWMPACRFHHGQFDNYRGVVIPRERLPEAFLSLMDDLGLLWWVDRRYGRENAADARPDAPA